VSVPNSLTAPKLKKTNNYPSNRKSPKTNGKREIAFIENLAIGLEPVKAMINAGYTPGYARSYAKRKLNDPQFISRLAHHVEKFPEHRTTLAKTRLPKLYSIEAKFLDKCENDPELYAKYSKLSEREYKLAGLLKEEVNIQAIIPVQVAIQIQTHIEDQQAKSPQITLDADDNE